MRKVKGFVWVFLLLMQYFWLFVLAYEVHPEGPIGEDIVIDELSYEEIIDEEFVQEDLLPQEDALIQEEELSVDILDDTQVEEAIEDVAVIPDNEQEFLLDVTDIDTVNTGDSVSEPVIEEQPLLLITEVYFGGTDERFELYNPHNTPFVWSIQVNGVKSSTLTINNLTIPAKTARIFGDNMLMISDPSVIERSALALNMVDTTPITIDLLYNGISIDTFSADATIMSNANKTPRASIQRTLADIRIVHIAPVSQNYNNTDPSKYIINPGMVYYSIDALPPATCEGRWSAIQIREVFWWNEDHTPYIELFAPQGFAQNITIGGTQVTDSFDISVNQPAGHYLIVSLPDNTYISHPYTTDNQKLSFNSELGNIIVYGQSGQVLDKVDIQVREDGYSSYIYWTWCQRVGDVVDNFSPGFARDYLSYFPEGAEKIVTVTQQIVVPSGWGSCSGDLQTGSIQATATGDFVMEFISIDYDPLWSDTDRESITLRSLVDYPLDLSVYALRLSTRNWLQYLRWVLEPEEEITLTGNFRFPNAGACVDLLYGDFVVDSYCYPVVWSWPGEEENDYSDVSITLDHLNYDPPGDDTNNEEITFTVHSWVVDFSHGFYILINGRKYNLTSFAWPRIGTFVLKANYRMPNAQDSCVSLLHGDFVFDTKCYVIVKSSGSSKATESIYSERFNYDIRIDHVDYDPEGFDTNNEKITLIMDNWSPVDLSAFHLLVNGTKKSLKEILVPWAPLTLVWTYWFPNSKQTCVVLQYQNHVYDTYCYDPEEDKEKQKESLLRSGTIRIDSIVYDPPGNDADHEELHIFVDWPTIDLLQWRYLLVNTTKKSLSMYWSIDSWSSLLTGTFSLPNTKDTCVSIRQFDTQFDEYCYQVWEDKKALQIYSWVSIDIIAVLPNPIGADAGRERVEVILHSPEEIDLSQGFSLLINWSKKKLSGTISWSDPYHITGSFALPNAASCISLLYIDTVLDTFCYPQSKEGIVYTKNSQTLLSLTDAELSLLKNTALTRVDNKLCLTLSEVTIKCRTVPAGKLAARQMEELKLSRNYITMLHDYLYNHWQLIYFNSDIIRYKTLFDTSKKDIGWSKFTRSYGSERLPISDIQTRFQLQYQQPLLQQLQWQVASKIFGPKLAQNYKKAKERYYKQ